MNKRFYKAIVKALDISIPLVFIIGISFVFYNFFSTEKNTIDNIPWFYIVTTVLYIAMLWLCRTYFARKKTDIYTLEKWIKYDKQRIEIEEQMDALSKQLMNSDVSKYMDINRLIFSGQSQLSGKGLVNYNVFFEQFGLEKSAIKLRENSGAFLTPFNKTGNELYKICCETLSKIGFFLQKSDNYVDKDNILMNIVSLIVQSEVIIVNIDGRNPNVYYELGIAHALGKPTILLSQMQPDHIDAEFDIQQKYIILYKNYTDLQQQLLIKMSQIKRK